MEGLLSSAKLDRVLLLADGVTVAVRASGRLKLLYGL
jgi:sulfur transfer complex TusBCD TusB component (DsrH family)